ncbi:DUF4287 domain-containing protein [Telmatocola sphagniphila]|uniref:DUF4287 domain-containing protein n=1 Tax=Telmatocola sphagniphila TaxID=1123043 RepID=A0A8E6BAG8_9BACT|nr:DUF5655 domain-containing protein [Telmatocola sphagniphila]QVL34756.1 DUF4287 domain-containing protein [Telmatocola sphagniphila]
MAKGSKIIYSVHPAVAMVQKSLASLKEKTGRTLEEWLAFIEAQGPADEKGRIQWLKEKQDLGTNYAKWLAERSFGKGGDEDSPEAYLQAAERYVQNMFSGPKAGLLPLYEKLISLSQSLGKDVKFSPCETIVPFYRHHVFAQVKPSTRTRIDFGLALGDTPATGRLIDTGGYAKKDRITHKLEVSTLEDIDAELEKWLKMAYRKDEK